MFTGILWRFLILETFMMGALCCSCRYKHPQQQFCQSEFVLLVNINKRIELSSANAFHITIKTVFKGDARVLNLTQNRFVILEMPWTCPIYFVKPVYDDYVIFGDSKNGNIYTTLCYGNMMWSRASPFFKRALETDYKNNCDCYNEIPNYNLGIACYWTNSYMKKRDKNCNWGITSDLLYCQLRIFMNNLISHQ